MDLVALSLTRLANLTYTSHVEVADPTIIPAAPNSYFFFFLRGFDSRWLLAQPSLLFSQSNEPSERCISDSAESGTVQEIRISRFDIRMERHRQGKVGKSPE